MFEKWSIEQVMECAARLGYAGVEVSPFTLANSVTEIPGSRRAEIRRAAEKNRIEVIGTHWLLVKPEGLSLSTRDVTVRRATSDYLVHLVRFTADIGGRTMVLGSPKQRNVAPEQTVGEVKQYLEEIVGPALAVAGELNVFLCIEPLGRKETNFINTAAEAIALIREINHPNFRLILDVKAMSDQGKPIPDIIEEGFHWLKHVHVNDTNLLGPGFGETDYGPIISRLKEKGYNGFLSVEVFDFSLGGEAIAAKSIEYLRKFTEGAQ